MPICSTGSAYRLVLTRRGREQGITLRRCLNALRDDDRLRSLMPRAGIDFSSNDYLALRRLPADAQSDCGRGGSRNTDRRRRFAVAARQLRRARKPRSRGRVFFRRGSRDILCQRLYRQLRRVDHAAAAGRSAGARCARPCQHSRRRARRPRRVSPQRAQRCQLDRRRDPHLAIGRRHGADLDRRRKPLQHGRRFCAARGSQSRSPTGTMRS